VSRTGFALLNLAFIFGAAIFGIRAYLRSNPDLSRVRGTGLIGPAARGWYFSNLEPFEHLFVRLRVRPAWLSYSQLLASTLTAVAYAAGLIYLAGFLVLFTGTLDILDGKVARRTNGESRRGAFLDSVIDRYAEFIGFLGLLIFFRSGWQVWATLLAILGGTMVSYTRARAEGLGIRCEVGLLQRPERFVLLGFGSIFSSVAVHVFGLPTDPSGHVVLGLAVALLALLSNITALQRAVYIHHQLGGAANA
jgi:CDP-diacylglycerol--glycerol-3-phosphate 3-phosphatidyltransferase